MLEYEETLRKKILERAVSVRWLGKIHRAVNAPLFISELGNALALQSRSNIGIVWYRTGKDVRVSLRGIGSADVAKIAHRFGGGGHPHAAAFRLKNERGLPWKILP